MLRTATASRASVALEGSRLNRAPVRAGAPAWAQIRIAAHRHIATKSRLDAWDVCGTGFIDCYCALTVESILFRTVSGFKSADG
jgi:hypothetical protein